MLGWAPCTGGWGTAAFLGNTPHCSCSSTIQHSRRHLRDLGQRREEDTVPRYPTHGLGLISACVVVSVTGSAMDQVVWQGSLGLLFLPLPFSPPPRSNSPGLSINCRRGSRGFQEAFARISADLKRDFTGMGGKYPRALERNVIRVTEGFCCAL